MNVREFFHNVVMRNYDQFVRYPDDIRLLWNALVSINTIAEYLALERRGYLPISRSELDREARSIRARYRDLSDLKFCADTFKHVRKIKDQHAGEFTTVATSTGVSSDKATWRINQFDVADVVGKAVAALNQIPELK